MPNAVAKASDWIPFPRFREDKLRGDDKLLISACYKR